MTRYKANYEIGTIGSSPSSGNPPPGIAARNGSVVYSSDHSRGTKSLKITGASSGVSYVTYGNADELSLNSTALRTSAYFYFTEYPSGGLIAIYDSVNTRPVARISVNYYSYTDILFLQDSGMETDWTSSIAVGTITNPIPLNKWVRIELYATVGLGNATVTASIFDGDSSVPIERVSSSIANTTLTPFSRFRIGKLSENSYVTPFWIDDVSIDTEAPDVTKSPYYMWNGVAYKTMDARIWTGSEYKTVIEV